MGNPGFRIPGAVGHPKFSLGDFRLSLDPVFRGSVVDARAPGPVSSGPSLRQSSRLSLGNLRLRVNSDFLGHRVFLQKALRELPLACPPAALAKLIDGKDHCMVFGPMSSDAALQLTVEENLNELTTRLNEQILLDEVSSTNKMSFWLVTANDATTIGGSGTDQGRTASVHLFVTWDEKHTGLTKLRVTVIDMQTPRGFLDGQPRDPSSAYRTAAGPYSGISSVDFEVTMERSALLQVKLLGSVGVDSTDWGKLVQDTVHKHFTQSPLFPWPRGTLKPFGEIGVATLVTPNWVLSQGKVFGVKYKGTIEFDAKVVTGTHRTEATAGARMVLRTATVNTSVGPITAEYSPMGVFARGFMRYNDGRPDGHFGVEGGAKSSFMLNVGRFGVGIEGEVTSSTDPSLQTGNPAGSGPLLNPLDGAPKGHHGIGRLLIRWGF